MFIGALSGVHQHTRIGAHAMIGGVSGVRDDIIPFGLAAGPFARLSGINVVGMKRRAYSAGAIRTARLAYRLIFFGKGIMAQRLDDAQSQWQQRIRCAYSRIHSKQGSSGDLPPGHLQRRFMTTVGHPPRPLHDHAATHEVRNGPTRRMACPIHSRSRRDCRTVVFARGEHNSQGTY